MSSQDNTPALPPEAADASTQEEARPPRRGATGGARLRTFESLQSRDYRLLRLG